MSVLNTRLVDPYGRPVHELRITVTENCNYSCIYCHKEGEYYKHRSKELSVSDIVTIVKVAASLGVRKVKLTGGEPLLRRDIADLISQIASIPGISEVSLVTNGYFLADKARELKEAGLTRVNVTLNTLDSRKYRAITGVDGLEQTLKGIEAAVSEGLNPVKINYVYLKGINEEDFWSIVEYASSVGVSVVRVIEYHEPLPLSRKYARFHADLTHLLESLARVSIRIEKRRLHNRPVYYLPNGVVVEIVKPMFNPNFCAACTKLRLTSDGWLKPCLLRQNGLVDVLAAIKCGEEAVKRALVEATLKRKPYFTFASRNYKGDRS